MNYNWKKIEDVDFSGKTVFVRVDFNVPLDDGKIVDATRIEAALPTLDLLLKKGAKLILASHLGRPKDAPDPKFTLKPVAKYLEKFAGGEVPLIVSYVEDNGESAKAAIAKNKVILLENLRFYPGEKKGDAAFAKLLASLADVYVDDAFGTAHRAHASIAGVPQYIPGYPGLLMRKEVESLSRIVFIEDKDRPFIALLGGAKVADKIPIISNLISRTDVILVGGGMAFTFLKAQGMNIGSSLVDDNSIDECKFLIEKAKNFGVDFVLPIDVVIAPGVSSPKGENVEVDKIPSGMMGLDIGKETCEVYTNILKSARSIFWNGPMGVFEEEPFKKGSVALARAIAEASAFSVVGGGDSIALINEMGISSRFGHVSTGGGASFEYISGIELPGIKALTQK